MFSCTQCTKSYKRPEHLQRHLATHSDERPYACPLCQATFQRSDVLRRHSKTCNGNDRISKEVSAGTTNFRTEDVVTGPYIDDVGFEDLSAYLDWLPDAEQCADFLAADLFPDGLSRQHRQHPAMGNGDTSMVSKPLRFLEGFTRNSGLVASFDCGTEQQRTATMLYLRSDVCSKQSASAELLIDKCSEIVSLVKEVVTIKPRNSPVDLVWSPDVEGTCNRFFNPQRLQLYLGLFWSLWHPNVNFVHRATFDAATTKATLVAAMAIIGAAVSPDQEHNSQASVWFNAVEEVVFIDDDFCSNHEDSSDSPALARIQSLQAAYIVCLYQNWEGTDTSRARIRRFRYSTVVATARDLGISNARRIYSADDCSISQVWIGFAAREQLIRTLLWVFLLDTAFVIFHNFPPRMAIKEMKMHFACDEQTFQATTYDDCSGLPYNNNDSAAHTLASLVEGMCKKKLDLNIQAQIAGLGSLNLFVVTSAIHVMIFQAQQTFNVQASLQPLSNALDNWIAVWHIYTGALQHLPRHNPLASEPITPANMWKRVGFSRFSDEYWLLARLITEKMRLSAQEKELVKTTLTSASSDERITVGTPAEDEAILTKYDETSMRQVNDLIADFQKILI